MEKIDGYKLLCNMIETLKTIDTTTTNRVTTIRDLIVYINDTKQSLLSNDTELIEQEINSLQSIVDNAVAGKDITFFYDVETEVSVELFQLNSDGETVEFDPFTDKSTIDIDFTPNSLVQPEHGTIVQKLWKVTFEDNTTGHVVFTDASDKEFSSLVGAQLSEILLESPLGSSENLDLIVKLEDLKERVESRDLSDIITGLERPGWVARQLRDINIDNDPELKFLEGDQKIELKLAVGILNSATTNDNIKAAQQSLLADATGMGLHSTSIGPTPNLKYSDLKRFTIQRDDGTEVEIVMSMPVVSWGEQVEGIPLRDPDGPKDKTNRKDAGTSYIVDMGGKDPVIRQGHPNPLPAIKFFNNGPNGATDNEGALDRYGGGKCVGMNTTENEISFTTMHRTDQEKLVTLQPMTGLWQLDRSTMVFGNEYAYYTVFSASRAPPSGFMGVVLAPKQNRLGRGHLIEASGVTLANGQSSVKDDKGKVKTFNKQDVNGPILEDGKEVDAKLKGVTSAFDGHGMDPSDLLRYFHDRRATEENKKGFKKGTHYLTIPADATVDNGTIEDILIPAGQNIPQITQAVATLMQFGNGKYIPDGGPNRFQSGLIPFWPKDKAYTPEWHINFLFYNCGELECEGQHYPITNVTKDTDPSSWIRPKHNASFGPPGPNLNNTKKSGFSKKYPETLNPVQLRCGIKGAECRDFIDAIDGTEDGEISLRMLSNLESTNKIFRTEAPGGALRGWVKFLIVNCPLPIIARIKVIGEEKVTSPSPSPTKTCVSSTCKCSREATKVNINGQDVPFWFDQENNGQEIGERVLQFKAGDNVVIKATSGMEHGVSLRMDEMKSHTVFTTDPLSEVHDEVLTEIETMLDINNRDDLTNNSVSLQNDVIVFHGGIPITFQKRDNPTGDSNGVVIANITVKDETEGLSGTVSCTEHGIGMSFRFKIC